MDTFIGYCGLECSTCPIHLATLEADAGKKSRMKESIIVMCREQYGTELTAEEVTDCDGCRSTSGRMFSSCLACEIRRCAKSRELESCAYCSDFGCEKVSKLLAGEPSARTRLVALRNGD